MCTQWNIIQLRERTSCHLQHRYEHVMLSEVSQSEKGKGCMIALTCGIFKKIKPVKERQRETIKWRPLEGAEDKGWGNKTDGV